MAFSSLIFIFVFLPAFLLIYYILPAKFKNLFIVIGGYFFYSWGAPRFALMIILTIIADYVLSRLIFSSQSKKRKKLLLVFSVVMNIGILAYFKYSNFFVGEINNFIQFFGAASIPWMKVVLPIGISFTIFQELSYIIEVYRGTIKPAKTVVDFAAYLMLFPHVIAGPIVRYIDISGQIESRIYSSANFFLGIKRFSFGLAKKVLIANTVAPVADAMFFLNTVRDLASPLAWLGVLAFAVQIYFDFSGYSDMAIGLAKMLGFDFKENFNKPYISKNITDFWHRWHISLSTWMREYLYIPLGGNRISTARTYLNLWLVFLLSGLWHGASWNFVIWGAFHGLLLILDKVFWLKVSARIPNFFKIASTFILVCIGWVFFKVESFSEAIVYIAKMFNLPAWFQPLGIRQEEIASNKELFILFLALIIVFAPAFNFYKYLANRFNGLTEFKKSVFAGAASLLLFALAIIELVNSFFNPFIYFRF